MRYYNYREQASHKTNNLPLAYYAVDATHPLYVMLHHWHTEYELVYVSAGRLELELDGSAHVLSAGQFALIGSGVLHSGQPQACTYACVTFDLPAFVKGHSAFHPQLARILSHACAIPFDFGGKQAAFSQEINTLFSVLRERPVGAF